MAPHVSLDEPGVLMILAKFMASLSILVNVLATYLVVTRSRTMRVYSWFLLNYMLTSCVFDFYMHYLMCPVVLFPYSAGYTTGPLWRILGIPSHMQMIILAYIMACQTISVILTFYWRFQAALMPDAFLKLRKRTLSAFIFLAYLSPIPAAVFGTTQRSTRQELTEFLVAKGDQLGLSLLEEPSTEMYLYEINPACHIATRIAFGLILGAVGMALFLTIATWRNLTTSLHLNKRKVQIQVHLLRCLVIQIGLPGGLLFVPSAVAFYTLRYELDLQYLCQWMLVLASMHSPFATVTVLMVTTPYRKAIVDWFSTGFSTMRTLPNKNCLNSSPLNRRSDVQAIYC